jgi:hypothetical protein
LAAAAAAARLCCLLRCRDFVSRSEGRRCECQAAAAALAELVMGLR